MTPPVLQLTAWECCAQPPGAVQQPDQLPPASSSWLTAAVPGTVGSTLDAHGHWDFDRPRDLDAEDWWYRTSFAAPDLPEGYPCDLCLDGLATLAEVWLNGRRVLTSDNMFLAHRVNVAPHLRPRNDLVLGFRSLAEDLKKKRPRPRWKTNLVSHQQLRWHRTTLLGRIPGWSPAAAPVGPWRAVRLDAHPCSVTEVRLVSRVEGELGIVTLSARVRSVTPLRVATLEVGEREVPVTVHPDGEGWSLCANLSVPRPPLWWPHTHGGQPLTACSLHLRTAAGEVTHPCGNIGFREVRVPSADKFSLAVNGVPVFCRGACWTVSDLLTLDGTEDTVARDLRLARDAGVNLLRVGGTMTYAPDSFYRLCDELGILVWQDFMFANMDYPVGDPPFAANIDGEARQQLTRLCSHPCVAVYCGNSEVEQQAALLGVPEEFWRNHWFATRLPELCGAYHPGVPYVPSTPSGGAMPFHVRDGVAHYYGVGAYLRPPQEVRRADVKFAPECLAFANIPEAEAVHAIMAGGSAVVHHPRWKQRIPRDSGAGWDFEDVRDFYLRYCFAIDPVRSRSFDPARYLQLSRVVPGEVMAQVFSEWRSGHGNNGGGLVWFFKDLWPAAGWGIVDSLGTPKAAYYYLRRSWRSRQIVLTEEGLDGLHLHAINETDEPLHGAVELLLLKDSQVVVARREVPCLLGPRGRHTFVADALLGGFYDLTYAYRFGPPQHDVVIATLLDERRRVLSEAHYFVQPREPSYLPAVRLDATAAKAGEGRYRVTLCSDFFLQSVSFDVKGFLPDDNYFHLTPGRAGEVNFVARKDADPRFRGFVEALNLKNPVAIQVQ